MKELTIEQKAKAYDEAIRKAKDMLSYKEVRQEDMEYLFPELKEEQRIDDETLRKNLIKAFNTVGGKHWGGLEVREILNWLEKQSKQKSAWSEEDMNKPNGGIVMEDFNDGNGFYKVNLAYLNEEQVEQIEELVKRWGLQPKRDEDESIISDLLDYFDEDKCLKHEVNDIIKWLKTIKPQQKGWGENEIKMLDNLITYLDGRKDLLEEIKSTYIGWLKSIKERYTWKPSDEQIEAFEHFIRSIGESGYASPYDTNTKLLYSLLEQLKKLK